MFDEKQFRLKMISAGLSIKDIANAVGVNEATLYRKIKGITDFTRNEMVVIRSVLHLNTSDFENIFFAPELTKTQEVSPA